MRSVGTFMESFNRSSKAVWIIEDSLREHHSNTILRRFWGRSREIP